MTIEKKINDDVLEFIINGRLDTNTSPELQKELIPAFDNNLKIQLNFADVNYVSSAGLRVLLIAEKTAKSKSAIMTLINVTPEVYDVFKMTGFSDMLTIL